MEYALHSLESEDEQLIFEDKERAKREGQYGQSKNKQMSTRLCFAKQTENGTYDIGLLTWMFSLEPARTSSFSPSFSKQLVIRVH